MEHCPCGTGRPFADCCGPVISGARLAETAEQLMRSRYAAYVKKEMAWLRESLLPAKRADFDEAASRAWADEAEWHGIEVLSAGHGGPADATGTVEFVASFTVKGARQEHRERAQFRKESGAWYFVEGKAMPPRPVTRSGPRAGRNDPCPCGSGKKYKKCCG